MRLNKTKSFYRKYFSKHDGFIYKLTKLLKLSKFFIQNPKGVSLVEIIVFSSIFLIFITGTSRFLINNLKIQTLKHSQTSELNLSEMLKVLDSQACLNTFSGKNIGDDLDHIRDKEGIPLISSPSTFKKNLKIVKIHTSARTTCSSFTVQSGQNCPPGCTNPTSFPGACQGMGYAELHIFFSRPGSLFEQKSKTGLCDSSDQSQCYRQSCIVKLTGTPVRGNAGDNIGSCELLDCGASLDGSLSSNLSCYKVEDTGPPAKVSLVGCGTTQDITKEETVAFGFDAGSSSLVREQNTFIGYRAGKESSNSPGNTFIGPYAGEKNRTGLLNTFIGYRAGKESSTVKRSTFIGPYAGEKNGFSTPVHVSGTLFDWPYHVFIGSYAGQNNKGHQNTFIGYKAGQENTTGKNNVFIGYKTGQLNKTGKSHVFIGPYAGKENTVGQGNIFIGYQAGQENTTGKNNVFIGPTAGEKNETGHFNTFIGPEAGQENTTGGHNTFIGYQAGKQNSSGNQNVFIGYKAGSSSNHNDYFVVGNELNNEWVTGKINTPIFKIQGQQVAYWDPVTNTGHTHPSPVSSRTLKKNIKSFKSFDSALEDILNMPLFTFEFKKDLPQKKRIGFISEELPPHLQIKDKISRPDMTSIRGTILASIKALYNKMKNLKREILKEMSLSIKNLKTEIVYQLKLLGKNLETTREELSLEIKKREQASHKKREDFVIEQGTKRASLTEELHKTEKELHKAQADLASTKKEMEKTKKRLKVLGEKLHAFK